jgi:hypothetical protein
VIFPGFTLERREDGPLLQLVRLALIVAARWLRPVPGAGARLRRREGPFHDRKGPLTCEPPIGIEPMTYALRGGLESSAAVHRVTSAVLARLLVPPVSEVIQDCC